MTSALAPDSFGVLTGTLATPINDPTNPSGPPGLYPASGELTFTPAVARVRVTDVEGNPVTLALSKVVVPLEDDGSFRVSLLATNAPGADRVDWTYGVTFALADDSLSSFSFALPGGQTTDLTSVTPLETRGGVVVTQGPRGEQGERGERGERGADGVSGIAFTFDVDPDGALVLVTA